ncbi:MAG: hypothetical protein ACKOEU_01920 [Limnohabitans sp.]
MSNEQLLNAEQLKALAFHAQHHCTCALKICKGWESVPDARWPADQMQAAGTLRLELPEGQMELTFEEFHPNGTRYDSPNAPIALDYFPYNRCDVSKCSACQCAVLKYTEYGGYYVDTRARLVDPEMIVARSAEA